MQNQGLLETENENWVDFVLSGRKGNPPRYTGWIFDSALVVDCSHPEAAIGTN